MKLLSLVCESMMWSDLASPLQGFLRTRLDYGQSDLSAKALWLMQSDRPLPDMSDPHHGPSVFNGTGFISSRHKTRIVSHYWPAKFNPSALDPMASPNPNCRPVREPNSNHWKDLVDLLKAPGDVEWVIYWSLIGHCECNDCRVDEENRGIPNGLKKTCSEWMGLIEKHVLPLCDNVQNIMVHGNHASSRRGDRDPYGFLMHRGKATMPKLATWADIRRMELSCLE